MKKLVELLSKSDEKPPALLRSGDNLSSEKALANDTAQAGFDAAAQDVYQALKANDQAAFSSALQTAIEMSSS